MINVRDEENLLGEIVADLTRFEYPTSWNLVIPPCFNEEQLVDRLEKLLREHSSHARVARIEIDQYQDVETLIRELHRQWSRSEALPQLPARHHDLGEGEKEYEKRLLDTLLACLPIQPPVVLLFTRFHLIAQMWGSWLLGILRSAERRNRVRVFEATPVNLIELRERQSAVGKILTVSNYGDTHAKKVVQVNDSTSILAATERASVPEHVAAFFLQLTGGYPGAFRTAYQTWLRLGSPMNLKSEVRREIRERVEPRLNRFLEWLDRDDSSIYRDAVINLHLGADRDNAEQQLGYHEWADIILNENGQLRSECLGSAALDSAIKLAADRGEISTHNKNSEDFAVKLYRQRQYHAAAHVLESIPRHPSCWHLPLLHAHARIMGVLYEHRVPTEDTDWRKLHEEIITATKLLGDVRDMIRDAGLIEDRYDELGRIAEQLHQAIIAARKQQDYRIVDCIAGLGKTSEGDPRAAALLLLLKYQAGEAVPAPSEALALVLPLPEQVFCVWAKWRLNLSSYSVPGNHDNVWFEAANAWQKSGKDPLHRPDPGTKFESFPCFVYFAIASLLLRFSEETATAPLTGFRDAEKFLNFYTSVRNDRAHTIALTTPNIRKDYFAWIDKWLDCLCRDCPTPVTRAELLALIEPLPMIDQDGSVVSCN